MRKRSLDFGGHNQALLLALLNRRLESEGNESGNGLCVLTCRDVVLFLVPENNVEGGDVL